MKLFRILPVVSEKKIFKEFFHVRIVPMFFDGSKFLEQVFEKGHPRNNPVKLFQNLTSGFGGEEF